MAISTDGEVIHSKEMLEYDLANRGVLRRTCSVCNEVKNCVWQENPFDAEIYHDTTKDWLCGPCEWQCRMDI